MEFTRLIYTSHQQNMPASHPPAASSGPVSPRQYVHNSDSKPPSSATIISVKCGSAPILEREEVVAMSESVAEKSASSNRTRRRDRRSKPKPKRKEKQTAQCVGYYVDALDKKMLWGEARIIKCNLATKKIKVHFVGWSNNHDIWTDPMSITAHGRYAPRIKGETVKSWDGDLHLFEDILGPLEKVTFSTVPVSANSTPQRTVRLSFKNNISGNTNCASRAGPDGLKKRSHLKRKAYVNRSENTTLNNEVSSMKTAEERKYRQEPERSSKRTVAQEESKKSAQSNVEQSRSSKRQKCEVQQPTALPLVKARLLPENKIIFPDQLPLFRDLEVDDGTGLKFSSQREKARLEHEGMESFLSKCALIWKKQLALSVQ